MLDKSLLLTSLFAFLVAVIVAFITTPAVKKFAEKIGAIDVPRDNRRMHKTPIPRVGGLAIFLGFIVSMLFFAELNSETRAVLIGALLIIVLGIVDDVVALKPWIKFLGQIVAAMIPVLSGMRIDFFAKPWASGEYFHLGMWAIPVTIIWIVGITNSVNFIDGLDGLACGVSTISSITMFTIAVIMSQGNIAIIMAALAGGCLGFLPYNFNPAKIFMGDTGSMFLGYILATASVQGLFKFYAVVSFAVPFFMLGLPIFDMGFAIIRRLAKGQSPLKGDKGHLHHRLINVGFDQKQSVAILYAISVVLGLAAVIMAASGEAKIFILALAVIMAFAMGVSLTSHEIHQNEKVAEGKNKEAEKEKKDE